jgi:hypothetical protein
MSKNRIVSEVFSIRGVACVVVVSVFFCGGCLTSCDRLVITRRGVLGWPHFSPSSGQRQLPLRAYLPDRHLGVALRASDDAHITSALLDFALWLEEAYASTGHLETTSATTPHVGRLQAVTNEALKHNRLSIICGHCYTYTVLACYELGLFELVCRRSGNTSYAASARHAMGCIIWILPRPGVLPESWRGCYRTTRSKVVPQT